MKLLPLRALPNYSLLEDSIRDSSIKELRNCTFTGRNTHYPNCLLETQSQLVNPYDERVMSLQRDSFYDGDEWEPTHITVPDTTYHSPAYFFVYNVDNYFHFLYDTLPYLVGYFELRKIIPDLHLVLETSHPKKQTLPPFVVEMLRLLGVSWTFVDPFAVYSTVFVSTSLTHGQKSNAPPSIVAQTVWNRLTAAAISSQISSFPTQTPKRFYVSRRTWVHNQTANLGTNYTTRRCCTNEDAVVALLKTYNIEEVFLELLTTEEKVAYFQNAELVVGVVGGGMCNCLFSPPTTKVLCLNTPYFLDINQRFQHTMTHTNLTISDCTTHAAFAGNFPLYSRVKVNNSANPWNGCVGEVEELPSPTTILVRLSSNDIAGFSQDFPQAAYIFDAAELQAVDKGLNSPYVVDIQALEANLKKLCPAN
jgi:hypothetical protein